MKHLNRYLSDLFLLNKFTILLSVSFVKLKSLSSRISTLLFIIEIVDFFRIAKNLANTDRKFLGDFIEPVYLTAIVFWIFAFYISRISMKVEKNLGLVNEGGGDAA